MHLMISKCEHLCRSKSFGSLLVWSIQASVNKILTGPCHGCPIKFTPMSECALLTETAKTLVISQTTGYS